MNNKNLIFLDKLVQALKSMSPADLEKISDPGFEVQIRVVKRRAEVAPSKANLPLEELSMRLTKFDDRGAAMTYLRATVATKRDLEAVARHLEMAISKQDTIEALAERIVETTVGARLRSRAIQGNLKDDKTETEAFSDESNARARER
ncbi:hypothetical protein [Ralstonia chuxiongensis]|uniref:Uncharacterized protein n=1 Tax=Ralstonia chuxiongensis TaxID=2957504 RepID=A0AA41WRN0_9RALS|nr:hypothetical protein [Ralstonia chuxiongensis]MCP1171519.1 hypothetical protein [Ralstonia chuxiongensis]